MDQGTIDEIGGVREKVDRLSLPRLKGGTGGPSQGEDGVTAGEAPWVNCAASRSLRQRRKSVSNRSEKLIAADPLLAGVFTGRQSVHVCRCAGACTRRISREPPAFMQNCKWETEHVQGGGSLRSASAAAGKPT